MSRSSHSSEDAPIYARDGNLAVVHIPGRRFPAVAVQGDTFHTLVVQAEEVSAALLTAGVDIEIVAEVEDLVARLRAVRAFFEGVLRDKDIARPYESPDAPWPEKE